MWTSVLSVFGEPAPRVPRVAVGPPVCTDKLIHHVRDLMALASRPEPFRRFGKKRRDFSPSRLDSAWVDLRVAVVYSDSSYPKL